MNLVKPVVAYAEGLDARGDVFLELLDNLDLPYERFTSWTRAGDLRRGQWLRAAARLEVVEAPGVETLTAFGGTFELAERLLRDRVLEERVTCYFNPAGGENPQHGVAALNDLAWAALRLAEAGLKVAVVDLDAHYPTALEGLLDGTDVRVLSIHEELGEEEPGAADPSSFGYSLGAGAGDSGFLRGLKAVVAELQDADLDVLILGGGADGLEEDEGSALELSTDSYQAAGVLLGGLAGDRGASILLGGGGGAAPFDGTSSVWLALFAGLSGSMVLSGATTSS